MICIRNVADVGDERKAKDRVIADILISRLQIMDRGDKNVIRSAGDVGGIVRHTWPMLMSNCSCSVLYSMIGTNLS